MFKRLKELCVTVVALTLFAVPIALPSAAAAAGNIANQVCSGAQAADGTGTIDVNGNGVSCSDNSTDPNKGIQGILKLVINVFSIIVGFVAVVMIIVGGFKYITSGGDSGNISGAKNTIVYAIVGLIIVALAQVIVHFVLAKASTVA